MASIIPTTIKPNPPSSGTKAAPQAPKPLQVVNTNSDVEEASGDNQDSSSLMVLATAFKAQVEAAEHQHATSLGEVSNEFKAALERHETRMAAAEQKLRDAGAMAKEALEEMESAREELAENCSDADEHLMRLRQIRMRKPKLK